MDRVALDLGFVQIYWYSICILIGLLVGMYLVYREASKKGINDSFVTNLIFDTVIISIIGARLYYVIFNWGYYSKHTLEIFEIWGGGLAIHGAIILGGLFLICYSRKHKVDTLRLLDICSVGLIIGQAIGRWGNFFNQEAHGGVVSLEFLKSLHLPQFIIDNMYIFDSADGIFAYRHPTFLYESLWCLLGFIILLIIRRRKYVKTGQIFGTYCIWYSIGRFFIEGLRTDSLMLSSLRMAQIVSIGMFLVGVFFVVRRFRCGKFDFLYNDVSYIKKSKNYFGKVSHPADSASQPKSEPPKETKTTFMPPGEPVVQESVMPETSMPLQSEINQFNNIGIPQAPVENVAMPQNNMMTNEQISNEMSMPQNNVDINSVSTPTEQTVNNGFNVSLEQAEQQIRAQVENPEQYGMSVDINQVQNGNIENTGEPQFEDVLNHFKAPVTNNLMENQQINQPVNNIEPQQVDIPRPVADPSIPNQLGEMIHKQQENQPVGMDINNQNNSNGNFV